MCLSFFFLLSHVSFISGHLLREGALTSIVPFSTMYFFFPLSRSNGGGDKIYCHGLGDDQCLLSSLLDGIKSTQPEVDMTSLLFIISEFLSSKELRLLKRF